MHKALLLTVILLLSYGFWLSDAFKGIAAGVSIFLFGMLSLEQGFKAFTGGALERILQRTTDTSWKSFGFGFLSATLMQSSGLVSVITVSFLSAGLLDLAAGIGIIFGSNLGTTTGAWLIAGLGLKVNIAAYAMPLLVFGVLCIFQRSKKLKGTGYVLSGLGFLLLGIHYMKDSFEHFENTINLANYAMPGVKGLLIYTAIGIIATIIMQSSHATMLLTITAVSVHQITYDNALALVIGANIGTTVTAIIASLGANIQGKRLAGSHLLINLLTGIFVLFFVKDFVAIIDKLSIYLGIAATDKAMKLATFHSLFNLSGIILFFPFIRQQVMLLEKMFIEKRPNIFQPKYLGASAMDFPETVVESVRLESIHLYENAIYIILRTFGLYKYDLQTNVLSMPLIERSNHNSIEYDIDASYEKRIKGIYSAIIAFISQVGFTGQMTQSSKLSWLREANKHLVEAIKDTKHLQKNWSRSRTSSNQATINEYNKIAYQIALHIQQIENFRHEIENNELPLLSLDTLKAAIRNDDVQMNYAIETLIREQKITPQTGSSLINDSAYMHNIKKNLLKAAETLFLHGTDGNARIERQLALNDAEINDIVQTVDTK
ncbi:Na/Pi cotransporter family protein [Candidatus Methylobacter oryzae]|uniref:Na/Pi cotransporter family protein n=1 Tax=Candidatus Methylobacter oryzae TaxID=2497749 RepID=A0ABY3CDL3_9GAMM|nr:Na/Pi symporter [Candidatus Methylobacter oryzae]TRW94760.1 Na/Pi cotransporter family protein [Candidatus Methylobacter oryzae]